MSLHPYPEKKEVEAQPAIATPRQEFVRSLRLAESQEQAALQDFLLELDAPGVLAKNVE